MTTSRKLLVLIGALIAAQIFSGCYFLRELNWSKDLVPKGKDTTAKISLHPTGSEDEIYFWLAMVGEGEGFTAKRPVFDAKNAIGQKQKLVPEEDLGEHIGDQCELFSPLRSQRGPVGPGGIWRTDEPLDSDVNKFIEAQIKAQRASRNGGGGFAGLIVTGGWLDDGDGVPEDPGTTDDEIACTGQTTTSFLLRGNSPPRDLSLP